MDNSRSSGLEILQQMLRGELEVPVCSLVGFRLTAVQEGAATFELEPLQAHYNLIGTVHGGIMATLLDSSMSCAVHSRLLAGESYATVEVNISYTRPVTTAAGLLRCEGQVVSMGSRTATASAQVLDNEGHLYAHGTTVCLIVR